MKVLIDGQRRWTLTYNVNGIDCAQDMIGNHGGLSDGQFTRIEDTDVYACSEETYSWWSHMLADLEILNDYISDMTAIHGAEAVDAVLEQIDCDLEDMPAAVYKAMRETFPA